MPVLLYNLMLDGISTNYDVIKIQNDSTVKKTPLLSSETFPKALII